jgi:hypothetical protein
MQPSDFSFTVKYGKFQGAPELLTKRLLQQRRPE